MENVPKIVRARLQRSTPPAVVLHPDADLLTAFAEQSLAGRERDQVLEHLARCGDCRDVVALALPATEPAALAASRTQARIGWLSLPVLRWGVVAAAVVAVTSVGILQFRQRHQEKTLVATSLESRDQLAGHAAQSSPLSPRASAAEAVAPQTETAKRTEMAKKAPAPSRAPGTLSVNGPTPAPHAIFSKAQPMHRSTSAGAVGGLAGGSGASSATPLAAPQTTAQNQTGNEPVQDEEAEDSVDHVGKAKPASAQASSTMAPAPPLRTEPTLVKGLAVPRWTISDNGALQCSLDDGKTWLDVDVAASGSASAMRLPQTGRNTSTTVQASAGVAEVRTETETKQEPLSTAKTVAKSAPRPSAPSNSKSAEVQPASVPRTIFRAVSVSSSSAEVWAGGSGGALYHTVDGGNRWTRVVPSDDGIVLTGDIIRIQFSDLRNGIVTTSNAEVWITVDAGQTWHKQQ